MESNWLPLFFVSNWGGCERSVVVRSVITELKTVKVFMNDSQPIYRFEWIIRLFIKNTK